MTQMHRIGAIETFGNQLERSKCLLQIEKACAEVTYFESHGSVGSALGRQSIQVFSEELRVEDVNVEDSGTVVWGRIRRMSTLATSQFCPSRRLGGHVIPLGRKFPRRRYLIFPRGQFAFIATTCVFAGLAHVAISFVEHSLETARVTESQEFIWFAGAASLIFLAFGIFLLLVLSNFWFGPAYRLQRHLERFSETGVAEPLKFRKGDFLIEVQDAWNNAIVRMNQSEHVDASRGQSTAPDGSEH